MELVDHYYVKKDLTNKCAYELLQQFKLSKPSEAVLHSPPDIYMKAMKRCWTHFAKELFVDGKEEVDTIVYSVMKFEAELTIMQSKGAEISVFGFPTHFDDIVPPPAEFHSNLVFRVKLMILLSSLTLLNHLYEQSDKPQALNYAMPERSI